MNTFRSSITIFYELDRTQWSCGHRMQIRTFELYLDLLVRRMRGAIRTQHSIESRSRLVVHAIVL